MSEEVGKAIQSVLERMTQAATRRPRVSADRKFRRRVQSSVVQVSLLLNEELLGNHD